MRWSNAAIGASRKDAKVELLRMLAWRDSQIAALPDPSSKRTCLARERNAIRAALVALDPAYLDELILLRDKTKQEERLLEERALLQAKREKVS